MKIIQKIMLIVLLLMSSSIYATSTKTINFTQEKNAYQHIDYTSSGASVYYSLGSSWDIGQHYDSGSLTEDEFTRTYVSGYYFPLTQLPPKEYIISCKLRVNGK